MPKHSHRTRTAAASGRRRGAALVEGAVVVSVTLVLLFGMLDLGLAVLRHNCLCEAARRTARRAAVHGAKAPPEQSVWGPAQYVGTAADATEMAAVVRTALVTMEPSQVALIADWPDDSNHPGGTVRVELTYDHQPMLPFLFGSLPLTLKSVAYMQIAH